MVMGLTFIQLLTVFAESWEKRGKEFGGELLLAKEGFMPDTKKFLDKYREMYPNITEKEALSFLVYLSAILDTIVRNNEAITKSLSL